MSDSPSHEKNDPNDSLHQETPAEASPIVNRRLSFKPAPIVVPNSAYGSIPTESVNAGSRIHTSGINAVDSPDLQKSDDGIKEPRKSSSPGVLPDETVPTIAANKNLPFSAVNPDNFPEPTIFSAASIPGVTLSRKGTLASARTPRSMNRVERLQTTNIRFKENLLEQSSDTSKVTPWRVFSWVVTCCFPSALLSRFGKAGKDVQQAWREKVALCFLILILCIGLGFITFFFEKTVCNRNEKTFSLTSFGNEANLVRIREGVYNISKVLDSHLEMPGFRTQAAKDSLIYASGKDASPFFQMGMSSTCQSLLKTPFSVKCYNPDFGNLNKCHEWSSIKDSLSSMFVGPVTMSWPDITGSDRRLLVVNNLVLDMEPYFRDNPGVFGSNVDKLITASLGIDATARFMHLADTNQIPFCLASLYAVARLESQSLGCFASDTVLYISLVIILTLIIVRFFLAVVFGWFMSSRLGKLKEEHQKKTDGQRKQDLASGKALPFPMEIKGHLTVGETFVAKSRSQFGQEVRVTPANPGGFDLEQGQLVQRGSGQPRREVSHAQSVSARPAPRNQSTVAHHSHYGQELYTLMLVTCYSEDEEGLRTTFDSLASTTYSEDYKLLFIVADGIIKGKGKTKSTPDMILEMLELDPNWPEPEPLAYFAIGEGLRQKNLAKVYVGWYNHNQASVPTILIVKCGTEAETKSGQKPGNRGKRDSQMILMRFLQHVTFDQPMSAMEFDLFQKIHYIMGVTPDQFEIVLMVDADTKVAPDSLARMVACMSDDPKIMGLCGETRIANKTESYITRIQVFEYYLSHHMTKAFESIFGNVTCLPGCFCMYRIKAPKEGYWVPILCNPQIVTTYAQNVVDTLHKKNLLLLGEDRFLTTLMLRIFPNRKLMFVPRAYCKTTVPNSFSVLLSQRRRWINSTIHNLLELILVRELCGAFCFSMQFVIFLEIIGTVTLPAAITFTTLLIIFSFIGPVPVIPLLLLAAILGLPAVLIALTSKRFIYIYWLGVYLTGLPIWNFILPVYAFWHFDDFSWGQTRQVEGEKAGGHGHGGDGGGGSSSGNSNMIEMKTWADWERIRRNDMINKQVEQIRNEKFGNKTVVVE